MNITRSPNSSAETLLDAAHAFGLLFIISGSAAFLMNATILFALFTRRRSLFSHVFYILIFNFALIDLLKSLCSIVWALKLLPFGTTSSMLFMKVDQIVLMALRCCNLVTIQNLLIITVNEYIFVVYPLRYRQIVTKWRVVAFIILSFMLAWIFTLAVLFVGSRGQSIYIKPNCQKKACIVRNNSPLEPQFVFNLGIIAFCFICLTICFICYTILIRVISRIVKSDEKILREAGYQICDQGATGCNKRDRRKLLRRNKYVIVIGSVIAIYTVYLISYSAIQVLYVGRLTRYLKIGLSRAKIYYIRWILQSLMCLHSVLQPLCYFRMREFRSIFIRAIWKCCRNQSLATENAYLSVSENHSVRRSTATNLMLNESPYNQKNNL